MSATFEFDSRLDTRCLYALYEGNMAYAMDMFEIYVRIYPAVVEKCREIIYSEDGNNKIFYVHSKFNDFQFVGLTDLMSMRHELEMLCRQGKAIEAHRQFSLIYKAFYQTFPLIKDEYERLKNFVAQWQPLKTSS